jgi:YVTN family beta-propeller protein
MTGIRRPGARGNAAFTAARRSALVVAWAGLAPFPGGWPGALTPLAAQEASGGSGTIYVGNYANSIYVVDEATLAVRDTIKVSIGIPLGIGLSHDWERFYVLDVRFERVEVIERATGRSLDTFTLSEGNKKVLIVGLNVDPRDRFAVLLTKTSTKHADRFEIGEPTLLRYDLRTHAVTDTIPWPEGKPREFAQILFSPDGRLMYFFSDDVLIYDAETLKQVDRWDLSQALDEGMGRFSFGFPTDIFEEPGFYTGLFRITDPVQNRRLMGVARVDLVRKDVEFYTLGPSEPVSFALAPDRRRAYGLRREVGNYEFWTFDLAGRRVAERARFEGRPRMGLTPSSNGRVLYIHTAGSTIDLYDSATFRHLRTVDLGADMTDFVLVPPSRPTGAR